MRLTMVCDVYGTFNIYDQELLRSKVPQTLLGWTLNEVMNSNMYRHTKNWHAWVLRCWIMKQRINATARLHPVSLFYINIIFRQAG